MAHHFTKSVMDIQEQTLEAEKTRRLNPPNSSSTHIILQLQTTAEGGKLKRTPRESKTPWFEMNKGQNYNGMYTFIPASRSEICNMSLKRCTVCVGGKCCHGDQSWGVTSSSTLTLEIHNPRRDRITIWHRMWKNQGSSWGESRLRLRGEQYHIRASRR